MIILSFYWILNPKSPNYFYPTSTFFSRNVFLLPSWFSFEFNKRSSYFRSVTSSSCFYLISFIFWSLLKDWVQFCFSMQFIFSISCFWFFSSYSSIPDSKLLLTVGIYWIPSFRKLLILAKFPPTCTLLKDSSNCRFSSKMILYCFVWLLAYFLTIKFFFSNSFSICFAFNLVYSALRSVFIFEIAFGSFLLLDLFRAVC